MNVYFYTTNSDIGHAANIAVIRTLQKVGATMYSNLEGISYSADLPKDLDAIVVLGEGDDRELAYVIALGIARTKPVLHLLEKGMAIPHEIKKISTLKSVKKIFKTTFFTEKKLPEIVNTFLSKTVLETETYTIKFTLRLNSTLQQYLKWKSKRTKMTKAVFVRKLIENSKQNDIGHRG